jgi:hypothetical protein
VAAVPAEETYEATAATSVTTANANAELDKLDKAIQ